MTAPDRITDEQVEAVARAFCKRMGLDPDGITGHGGNEWCWWKRYERQACEASALKGAKP